MLDIEVGRVLSHLNRAVTRARPDRSSQTYLDHPVGISNLSDVSISFDETTDEGRRTKPLVMLGRTHPLDESSAVTAGQFGQRSIYRPRWP